MKKIFLIATLLGVVMGTTRGQTIESIDSIVTLKNNKQAISFNLRNGLFDVTNQKREKVIENAFFQMGGIQSKDKQVSRSYTTEAVTDSLGNGKMLTIRINVNHYSDFVWQAILYDESDYMLFNMGIINDSDKEYKILSFSPLICNNTYKGSDHNVQFKILEGASGGARTFVKDTISLTSFNNLLLKFGNNASPSILVAGGATYHEFEKFVSVRKRGKSLSIKLFSEDPVGRLVDRQSKYIPNEKFYLCINNKDPFTALEKYAKVLKTAQNIKLNMYDFPTECLWYASFYNNEKGRRKFNDTKGAVEEMDNAIKSGITNYTRVAIRLVPDAYGSDNQQGWWDDKHWGMYGEGMSTDGPHYIEPYLTTKSWSDAILKKGGIPITYFQSGRHSGDYAQQHPGHMLFNDPYRAIAMPERFLHRVNVGSGYDEGYFNHWWTDKMLWSYDFTDHGFIKHMKEVYQNLNHAGIKGIMYDYPEVTAYAFDGGFEDKYKTAAWAYRNMYNLAYQGLGKDCYLDERNLLRGSDITLGLVASQRVWADTDGITPEMVSRCGLRWYKNRTVINYDMDSKDPSDALPLDHQDGNRSLLTMCYLTSGRFLLGRSFSQLSKQQLHDMSRTFPYHTSAQSARPIDAFNEGIVYPKVYDFEVTPSWHQLTFYNYNKNIERPDLNTIEVSLSNSLNEGGMALDPSASYYVYDFWNNSFVGVYEGSQTLKQTLREGEARMMSVHKKENNPQFISTDRHLMQGYLDLKECIWNEADHTLSGTSLVIKNEPYKVVIATNGKIVRNVRANSGKITMVNKNKLIEIALLSKESKEITWKIQFKK